MRQYGLSFLFLLAFAFLVRPARAEQSLRVFALDAASLARTKAQVAEGAPGIAPALKHLRKEADKALQSGPFSVTEAGPPPQAAIRTTT